MTVWDFLDKFIEKGGLPWTLLLAAIVVIGWMLAHPQVIKEWNAQFTLWAAAFIPRKRKKAFEKRLNLTIDSAKTKFNEIAPPFLRKFLPYDLRIEWINDKDSIETITQDKQIIVFVPSYKNELSQAVGVLHNYCSQGFAEKAKYYMPQPSSKATDLIITQKLTQYAGHNIYDYFNREYLPGILTKDPSIHSSFEKLQKVDKDGLFIPVLINEIDKYSNSIYPSTPSVEIADIISRLTDFIYRIAVRNTGEIVPLIFIEDRIKIKVVLAISNYSPYLVDNAVKDVEKEIQDQKINTIYVLATGTKIEFARLIADQIYNRNPLDVYEPIETNYRRYTRRPSGADSVCFEINRR